MVIQNMFVEDINRKINGVVKVDEDENKVLEQELNEYVITRELKRHFADFFNTYAEAFDEPTADTGVWISGFFGSGKSHFLKMLSYLLENKEVNGIRTVERFRKKFEDDPGTFMQVDRATKGETETILFNIDYEGSINKDKTAVLRVFAKVFYNHLGFFGSNLKVAMLEQYITQQGKMDEFCRLIEEKKGKPWTEVRKAFAFNGKFIKPALAEALDISEEDANNWFNDKSATELSVSQLVEDINAYVSTKPANFRLLFMVDEAGQYVGTDTDMLLNLQSLVEKIGSECRGNALREALQEHLIFSIARPMALHDGETFEEWKLEDAQSLLSEQMKELLTKAQNRSKGYFKAKMLDKNLCVIWPELVSCGGENPQKKDLTNEDNVVELLKKETCTETFQEKMNKIINQRYIYYPYLIKPADLMLARLMYDLVRKKDLEDLNKIEEIFKQCWQLNYSPLPFEGWTNNRFIEENIKTGELNKQPVFQIGKPSFSKIRVAVANIQMDISNFDQAVMRKPNRSYRRYQQIAELVNTAVREKADMLVMPEACTPKEWLPTLARTCEKNHLAVVTGVEHIIEDNCVYNLTAVILPYEEKWTGQWHSVILYHSKNHFAPEEKRMIESLHLRAMEGIESSEAKCDAKYELYSWNGFWFTVYCCFELTSIRDRSIFQSYIDAVIAVEWNHDVNYYSNIIESLSRDIHCYCIQTNTSEYGDSRITKPSKTENKDILRIKGGSNATAHVGTIDLEQLREFQMKAYSGQKEDKTFKPTPPDFDYKGAYERRKGTMFECFCAKKKAD